MDKKTVLIVNDIAGYGRVSTFAMLPIFAHCGYHPYVLPTALVSNTMDYGSAAILDTSDFMRNTIKKWNEFGFSFDIVSTGLINSDEQVSIINDLLDTFKPKFFMVDPIMADDGKLYPDMYPGAVECNRKLISKSNLMIPNLTEATMIAGIFEGRKSLSDEEYRILVEKLVSLGAKDIVITGCTDIDNHCFNLVYSADDKSIKKIFYNKIKETFIGTGDVFSATLLCGLIRGKNLKESVSIASDFVIEIIKDNINNKDHFDLFIEETIKKLKI